MSTSAGSRSASRTTLTSSRGPGHVAADHHRRAGVAVLEQQVPHGADLPGAALRRRVVDRQHQVGGRGRGEPGGDDVPRLEPVRQRDHRVVVAQRRADPAGDRLRGGHRRDHPHAPRPATAWLPPAPRSPSRRRPGHRRTPPRPRGPVRPACTPAGRGPVRRCCRWGGGADRRGRGCGRGRGRSRSGRSPPPARGGSAASSSRRRRGPAPPPRRCRWPLARRGAPGTIASEKYGTLASSTSAAGSTRCCGVLARST